MLLQLILPRPEGCAQTGWRPPLHKIIACLRHVCV